jgi:hypothetical protein
VITTGLVIVAAFSAVIADARSGYTGSRPDPPLVVTAAKAPGGNCGAGAVIPWDGSVAAVVVDAKGDHAETVPQLAAIAIVEIVMIARLTTMKRNGFWLLDITVSLWGRVLLFLINPSIKRHFVCSTPGTGRVAFPRVTYYEPKFEKNFFSD